jgi:hypothetical protein
MKTLILVARDIYPHDKVADRYYAIAMKSHDDKAAGNPAMKAEIEGFALDGAAGEGGYVGADASKRKNLGADRAFAGNQDRPSRVPAAFAPPCDPCGRAPITTPRIPNPSARNSR